jgi:hypothetical protein
MIFDVTDEVFNDGLPASVNTDEQVVSIGDVSDLRTRALLPTIDQLRVLCNIYAQPEGILDLLAFQFQVLFYSGTFSITDPAARLAAKQTLIANNFNFHAHLGTPATMQAVISAIYQQAFIQEWFTYGGTPNHYRILFDNVISSPLQAQISQTQRAVKRASQAFDGFFVINNAPLNFYVAVGVYTQIFQTLPIAISGRIGTFIIAGATVGANATVQHASAQVGIHAGATIGATAQQIVAGSPHATIAAKATMTNSAQVLRALAAMIRAGHG